MIFQYVDYSSHPEGYLFEQNLKRKGILGPHCDAPLERALIAQTTDGTPWIGLA